ncbi:MAG TPA: KUP/HAK/KT family potassium transporter, partial [Solirubrobacteraceae bacterium]|nr:KUP/HAK/KT family potassium transporter [Solirubrobacteraceae bacterium]
MSPRLRRSLFEAGHKVDVDEQTQFGDDARRAGKDGQRSGKDGQRRVLHEAAHKLETPSESAVPEKPAPRIFEVERDVVPQAGRAALALAALGVVFGDIGTSPLYTEQVVFTTHKAAAQTTVAGVYGVVSLIFWALVIVVSFKYAGVIMRAHNRGDGGILALTALIRRCKPAHGLVLVTLGIFGASLFLGDGMITPAISVLSAVEGLKVATPGVAHLVMPIALAVLVSLFVIQRWGTGAVGALFGPVMLVWFGLLALLGIHGIVHHPGVFAGLSPTYAVRFFTDHGGAAFLTLGSIVLAVTGAEALYADRGHFGTAPIRMS